MQEKVAVAIGQLRKTLLPKNSDVKLLGATRLGVVTVALSGECCTGRMRRLLTLIDIENEVKKQVPEVRVVIEAAQLEGVD